jgi:hypothetical protein
MVISQWINGSYFGELELIAMMKRSISAVA